MKLTFGPKIDNSSDCDQPRYYIQETPSLIKKKKKKIEERKNFEGGILDKREGLVPSSFEQHVSRSRSVAIVSRLASDCILQPSYHGLIVITGRSEAELTWREKAHLLAHVSMPNMYLPSRNLNLVVAVWVCTCTISMGVNGAAKSKSLVSYG